MKINALLLFLLASLLCGCSSGSEPYGKDGDDCFVISFQVAAPAGETRAESEEAESQWPVFEDLIDIDRLACFVFVDNGDTQPLLLRMTAGISNENYQYYKIPGIAGGYVMTAKVSRSEIETKLNQDLSKAKKLNLIVAVLANGDGNTDIEAANFSLFTQAAQELSFDATSLYGNTLAGTNTGIPMFGLARYTINEESLVASNLMAPLQLGQVQMLRAAAKLCVYDWIAKKDGFPILESVTFSSALKSGYQLPAGAAAYTNGTQVTAPNIFATAANTVFTLKPQETDQQIKMRASYVPEQAITGTTAFDITLRSADGSTKLFHVPMTSFTSQNPEVNDGNEQIFKFGANILRNHLYSLIVETQRNDIFFRIKVNEWKDGGIHEFPTWDLEGEDPFIPEPGPGGDEE